MMDHNQDYIPAELYLKYYDVYGNEWWVYTCEGPTEIRTVNGCETVPAGTHVARCQNGYFQDVLSDEFFATLSFARDEQTVVEETVEETVDYDPSEYSVVEVRNYLDSADDDARSRVIEAEKLGKNRSGIVKYPN